MGLSKMDHFESVRPFVHLFFKIKPKLKKKNLFVFTISVSITKMEKQKEKKISYMNALATDIHALPEIKASKLDSRPLSVVSFFQLSAKSGSGRKDPFSVFSFCLTKQILKKKTSRYFVFCFWLFFYFEKQMNV